MRGVDISSITAPNQGPGDMAGQKRARTPDDVKNKTVQNVNIPHDTTTGFENLLGQTNMFTMDSQNMSLGASNNNIMPNLLVGHNNHTILDKERQPKKENVDEQQIKWEAAEQNDASITGQSHLTHNHSFNYSKFSVSKP